MRIPLSPPLGRSGFILSAAMFLLLPGCEDDPVGAEPPPFRDGSTAELAIELPPENPPRPLGPKVQTRWSVVSSGRVWLRNVEDSPLRAELVLTHPELDDPRTTIGYLELTAFKVERMRLEPDYLADRHREGVWEMRIAHRTLAGYFPVSFAGD